MPTRNIVLTDRQAAMIDTLVQSGRYQNASEVLREGLRMVETRHLEEAAKLDALRAAAQIGVADLERGAFKTFPDADALSAHINALADKILAEEA